MGNMYCKGQITMTPEGKENFDRIFRKKEKKSKKEVKKDKKVPPRG